MKTFTDQEVAQIAVEFTRQRVEEIAKSLKELRGRELKKALVPPTVSNGENPADGGIKGIAPGKVNPRGKEDAMKAAPKMEETSGTHRPEETSAKVHEVLCKECGKSHDLEKGCTPLDMEKAMLKDSKGKVKDNGIHPDSTLPEDADSEEVSADGSGGDIEKGKAIKKSELAKGVLAAMPKLKDPSKKQGYYGEHEEQATKVLPHGGAATALPAVGVNPKRAEMGGTLPATRDEAKPDAWKPGHTFGGGGLLATKKADKPMTNPVRDIARLHSKRGAAGSGVHDKGTKGDWKAEEKSKEAKMGAEESAPSGKPKYTGPRLAGDPNVKKSGGVPEAKPVQPPTPAKPAASTPAKPAAIPTAKAGLSMEAKQHALMAGSKQALANQPPAVEPAPKATPKDPSEYDPAQFMPPAQKPGIFGRLGKAEKVPGAVSGDPAVAAKPEAMKPEVGTKPHLDKLIAQAKDTGKKARQALPAPPLANPKTDPSK